MFVNEKEDQRQNYEIVVKACEGDGCEKDPQKVKEYLERHTLQVYLYE